MEMLIIGIIAIAAFAAVLFPLFRRRPGFGDETEFENIPPARTEPRPGDAAADPDPADPTAVAGARVSGDDALEAEVRRYRDAVRAGTVCRKCGQANPGNSAFCFECGARLPLADAKEFE
jgi:ribosomal protein L40E